MNEHTLKEQIKQMILKEDVKNPLTDEEISSSLGILRETVTNLRRKINLPDSRERRKQAIFQDMKEILNQEPEISERKLTRLLAERGYTVGKYAVGKLKEDLLSEWKPESEDLDKQIAVSLSAENDFFHSFIGSSGSMKNQLKQVQAAILYPPKGLHCLLYGPSGVGKSYLAELMYKYALTTDNFADDAPFFAFNCADYADNPQLLMSQLYGYNKGAFTGASENKKGIVEQCNGGILFLDEVHRLPPEGQEILFYLMDKGKFRRLGEVDTQRESRVMIIAATTEDPSGSLLLTFRRRIPMIIEIPPLSERPLKEKLQFINLFFWMEASRLEQQIRVQADVIRFLADSKCPGNVGALKSDIQVSCARAFLEGKTRRRQQMTVSLEALSGGIRTVQLSDKNRHRLMELVPEDILFSPNHPPHKGDQVDMGLDFYTNLEQRYHQLKEEGMEETQIESCLSREVESRFQRHIDKVKDSGFSMEEISHLVGDEIIKMTTEIYELARKKMPYLKQELLFPLAIHLSMAWERMKKKERIVNNGMKNINALYPLEYDTAVQILKYIEEKYYVRFYEEEAGFLAMYFQKFRDRSQSEGKISVLVVSHGHVACGMAEVANAIMGVNHAVGLEMSLKSTPVQMIEKVIRTVRQIDSGKGVLILADMGTLTSMKEQVEKETQIPIRILGRTDTLMVIEAIRKTFWTDSSMDEIADSLDRTTVLVNGEKEAKKPREKAILCLCITGEGSAIALKKYLEERLKSSLDHVQVVTRGYIEHSDVSGLVAEVSHTCEILAIVGTIDPQIEPYPFFSVRDIYEGSGLKNLRKILKRRALHEQNRLKEVISPENIFLIKEEAIKEQILDQSVEYMVHQKMVLPEFLLSVYKRESMMPTFLKGGIAIPHGATNLVTKPAICITKLDKPVDWDGMNLVDLVFMLALDENSKDYFVQLYQLISDEWLISTIRNCRTSEEIYNLLCHERTL